MFPAGFQSNQTGAKDSVFNRETDLQKKIHEVRVSTDKTPATDRLLSIAGLIDADLKEKSCGLLQTEEGELYLLWKPSGRLYNLDSQAMTTWLSGHLAVSPHEKDGVINYVLDSLRSDAFKTDPVPVRVLAAYNQESGALAVSDGAGGVWRRERLERWERAVNGDGGIFFLTYGKGDPWQPEFGHPEALDWFFERMSFDPAGNLTRAEYATLMRVFMLSLFFPPLRRTRPIPAFLGIKGSGKTSAIRMIGRLLEGDSFEVTDVRENNEDGYIAAVCNSTVLGLDNADTQVSWLEDTLALYATGHEVRKRKLYSNNEMVAYRPRATVLIASRDPHFRRDDVAQRLLQFHFAPPSKYQPESELWAELRANRGKIIGELLTRAGRIADALAEGSGPSANFRMADFAAFGWVAMVTENRESEWFPLLEKLENVQAGFATEGSPIVDALAILLEREGSGIVATDTATLFENCRNVTAGGAAAFFKSPRSFSKSLSNMRAEIERELGVTVQIDQMSRKKIITIAKVKK
jgi:hypothetical protein